MSELDLFTEVLTRTNPAERAAFLEQACAGNAELRRRLEELLAGHAQAENPLDRPPVAPGEFGATFEHRAPSSTGACPPEGATEAFEHTRPGATSALESEGSAPPPIAPTEHGPDGGTAPLGQLDPNATTAAERTPHAASVAMDERVGTIIAGRYTLVDVIGEGGMGTVYLASQTDPVKRQVALKLIKTGMDSRGVLARFDAERQALAMMDHPNIARIYDGGLIPANHPFFVMELVKGVPITAYCDQKRLSVRARLELFVAVCQAVQHAHQKGIIHRDLKPGNVLVTEVDGRPTPKVIDFGVAKATEQSLTDMSLSYTGAIVGTPAYMSPEQADPSSMDIDTRTDVYALGVILYELLVGSPPLEAKDFRRGAILEMLRMVREVDPPRPSTKLSTAKALPNIAANRSIEPARLSKLLQGELDWVVMKALEKNRNRRYETANGFARDIQRYLADEVVEARPPSRGYRFKKFVKRNKGQVIAASLVLMTLLAGIAGTTFGMIRAEKRRQEAERNLAFAKKGNEILGSVFAGLDPKKNYADLGELSNALKDNLKQAVKDLEGSALGDPLEVAAMQDTLATSLFRLGEPGLAIEVLEKARDTRASKLGPDHVDTLATLNDLALAYNDAARFPEAIGLLERVRNARIAKLGSDNPDTLYRLGNLALAYKAVGRLPEAIALYERVRDAQIAKLGPAEPRTLGTLNNLAIAYQYAGKLPEAIALFERVRDAEIAGLGPDHPSTLTTLGNLAIAYKDAGRLPEAIALCERVRDAQIARLGPDHPNTLIALNNLAIVYQDAGSLPKAIALLERARDAQTAKLGADHPYTLTTLHNLALASQHAGKLPEAIALFERVCDSQTAKLGPDNPSTLITLASLAGAYQAAGRLPEAIALFERVRDAQTARLGTDHPDTLTTLNNLAEAYQHVGKLAEAIALFERVHDARIAKVGPDHPYTLTTLNNLAEAYWNTKQLDKSVPLYEHVLKRREAKLGPDHPDTLKTLNNLAAAYWSTKQLGKSVPLFEEALKRHEAKLGRQHPDTQMTVANLGVNYKDAGRLKEAIPLLEEAHRAAKQFPTLRWVANQLIDAYLKASENAKLADLLQKQLTEARKALPMDSPQLAGMLAQTGMSLLVQKKWTEAEPLLRECLAIREKAQPDVWSTFNTQSLVGGALLGQKNYAEAEPLLLAGYEGMKQREKTIPPDGSMRLPEAVDRLIELFTATNKANDAKKWQAERAKYPAASPEPAEKK